MTSGSLGAVIAPVLTPFGADGEPDAGRFVAHARWLLADGCSGLAPFGTTSEANSLGLAERKVLLVSLLAAGIDPDLLMPGTGLCSVPDTVELTRHAVELGCAGVLMLPPFYYKGVSDDGLFRYFGEVIERVADSRLRIYLYHIPPVAQVGFSLGLIGRLRRAFPEVIAGLKDSSGDWAHTRQLIQSLPGLRIYSGSEATLHDNLKAGGAGCISASANVNAQLLARIVAAVGSREAEVMQTKASAIRKEIQTRPVIPLLKAMLAHYRGDTHWRVTRPPLMPLASEEALPTIRRLESDLGFRLQLAAG